MNIKYVPAAISVIGGAVFGLGGKPTLKFLIVLIFCCIFWFLVEVIIKGRASEAVSTIIFQSGYSRATYWFWCFFIATCVTCVRFFYTRSINKFDITHK